MPKPLRLLYFNWRLPKILSRLQFDLSLSLGRTVSGQMVLCPGNHKGYLKAIGRKVMRPNDLINHWLDVRAYRKNRLILAASKMMIEEMAAYYKVPEEKMELLYPPLNTSEFIYTQHTDKAALREKYNLPLDQKIFLFVSVGHKRKGFALLRKVFGELTGHPFLLLIAGATVPEGKLLPNIRQLGFVRQMKEIYQAVDFTVHPAVYEPFGQIVPESLQCNTPVIVSSRVGAKELLDNHTGIVVDTLEPSDWKGAVLKAVQQDFHIPPDFATIKKITLQDHMQRMLHLFESKVRH